MQSPKSFKAETEEDMREIQSSRRIWYGIAGFADEGGMTQRM